MHGMTATFANGLLRVFARVVVLLALVLTGSAAWLSEGPDLGLEWGAAPDKSKCPDEQSFLWVQHDEGFDCIRYFVSGHLSNSRIAILHLSGDRDGFVGKSPSEIPENTKQLRDAIASKLASDAGVPVILLARPGTYGSSGDHRQKRQTREFLAINAAVALLRQRYSIDEIVLWGHSGGATAVAALLTMGRLDVKCAVLTSGAFGLIERARRRAISAGRAYVEGLDATGLPSPYDPMFEVNRIPYDADRRIYIFGNSKDASTPFDLQERFASELISTGHDVEIKEVPAIPPRFHDLSGNVGFRTAVGCAR